MYQESLIVRTKLAPPRLHRHTLHRARLSRRLLEALDYRLTILQAGAGYGKTTALVGLAEQDFPLIWYHLDTEDVDPLVFLLHLVYGFINKLGDLSDAPLALLERWESESHASPWNTVIDVLVNDLATRSDSPVFLVIDDAHHINDASESIRLLDHFIGRAPPNIHAILSSRYPLQLPNLVNWRVHGQVLEIDQGELAFTVEEVAALFRDQYGLPLNADQLTSLSTSVEGWPIALQLVWQHLQNGTGDLNQALGQLSGSAGDLFFYLAQEVLLQQPADIQDFLRDTAVMRQMTPATCNCLRSTGDSEQILRHLVENDLFVVDLGNGLVRYHHIFHELLTHQSSPEAIRAMHLRAASCYQHLGDGEEALYHLLAGPDYGEAARILVQLGRGLVRAGRLDTLAGWIEALPPDVLEDHPPLMAYLGDIARLHSHFEKALGWYQQAEERSRISGDVRSLGQALRGQARVYLDTVNPSKAERLLQEALRLSDGQEDRESRARLLELLAENLLNRGQSEEAAKYQAQAKELREEGPAEAEISVRLLLRTGRLDEARRLLEERAEVERQEPVLRPRAHRETLLLLSLVLSFQGQQEKALQCAVEGTQRGQALNSHFITAVGYMRQGHAQMLQKDEDGYQKAARLFQQAIELSERLEVPRLKVEAYWGLCQAYGFGGDLEEARRVTQLGIEIARSAGDEWVEACIRLSLGASYTLAKRFPDAIAWLAQAHTAFRECSDTHGETVARLWQCFLWQETGDTTRLERDMVDLLQLTRQHNYDFLFRDKTLLGPPDPRSLVPILLFGKKTELGAFAGALLSQLGLANLELHPGYQLKVKAFGSFGVWRGNHEIMSEEWRRKKARQLFLLLITKRRGLLERDQIIELLWPDLEPEEGQRDFKIAMSALYAVLEPKRGRNAPSAFIVRDGTLYGLRPGADLWLDAEQFDELVASALDHQGVESEQALDHYRQALALYQGEYLQEYPYEEWSSEERERLLTLYLRVAERLAQALLTKEEWEETIEVCHLILARDDCWENAYRLMMVAYDGLGNQSQVLRTYQRCMERLRTELEVEPAALTVELYEKLLPRKKLHD